MGTRIALENLVRSISSSDKVKVFSFERGTVTVFSDNITKYQLEKLFPAHLNIKVKPYELALIEGVPELNEDLPLEIFEAAKSGNLNKKGIEETVFLVFPHIQLKSMDYDNKTNIIYFSFNNELTTIELDLLNDYLNELTPVECKCSII